MSDPERESPLDLAAAYALGALDAEERRAFEAYLAEHPEAAAEVSVYRELAGRFGAATAGLATPAPLLRDRVLAAAPTPRETPVTPLRGAESARVSPVWWVALAASIAVMLTLGWQLGAARTELDRRAGQLASVRQQLDRREAELNWLIEPGVALHRLSPTDSTSPTIVQLFVDRTKATAVAHAFRLPALPAGKVYQLWFIEQGKAPIPSVTFRPEPSGHAMVQQIPVPPGAKLSLAAVTVEPEGGSPAPTTPPILAGAITSS